MSFALLLPTTARATLTFYTDRPTWEAALAATVRTEDLESETPGVYTLPYTTSNGVLLESVLGTIDAFQIWTGGYVDGTQELHVRDFSNQMRCTFPNGWPVAGFGFDWYTAGEDWDLLVGGSTVPLPARSSGFVGVVDDARSTFSFIVTSAAFAQGGISIDNLSYGFAFDVYTDRASWQAALSTPIRREDFESEIPATYPLPYTTAQGLVMDQVLGTINAFQILSGGLINGSQEMHVRDFGNQLSCAFPGSSPQFGFGFDWLLGPESWEMRIGNFVVPLPSRSSGFLGIVDPAGTVQSFVLTSSAFAQGGISVDDLEHSPNGPVSIRGESWAAIKVRYR